MTNDGELAYRLAHPKYQVTKIYHAIVEKAITSEDTGRIADGIELEDGHTGTARVRILTAGIDTSKVEVTLTEGHKRQVKQLLKAVGHKVLKLRRIEFAGIKLGSLKWGQWRHLSEDEVRSLKKMVDLE
jgi:pseudouridine synthase